MQASSTNILFVCSRNQWRSPTAERIYRKDDSLNVRSAGVSASAKRRVSERDLIWADIIIAMDASHADRLRSMIRHTKTNAKLHTLDIPDLYQFMDPELINLLKKRIDPILP
ncbi:low molecular weight protein tyrosine phosphatase family protein [Algimonas ampicilliniresistens]|uniref:low molecular weight protein tyrosine phosphatase family protein n=1 Tax=Algimonas ampicilliniresistens TaxID=1298735 RepID=UPI0024E16A88|nr:protein tyrosine phosphatase [Algimonas ampicilliniresistens]